MLKSFRDGRIGLHKASSEHVPRLDVHALPEMVQKQDISGDVQNIFAQDGICQGGFLQKLQIDQQNMLTGHLAQFSKVRTALNWLYSFKLKTYREPFSVFS